MLGIRDNFVKVLKKILLLDHKTRVTQTLRRALESAGKYSIREEHDAAFAVHAARWFRPDLIMVDLTNAASDGEIIARQLQKDRDLCHVPLLEQLCFGTAIHVRRNRTRLQLPGCAGENRAAPVRR